MRWIFYIIFFSPNISCSQQLPKQTSKPINENEIEKPIEIGEDEIEISSYCIETEVTVNRKEWITYLENNMFLDSASTDTIPAGAYTVLFKISIDINGKIDDVIIVKDSGHGLGQRVIEGMKNYRGSWKPATQNGKIVKSYRVQPITFIIEDSECEETLPAELML